MLDKLNQKISELIGAHIGDGTLYKTGKSFVWELRGDIKEKEYYEKHIKNLLELIFKDLVFKPKFRSGGKNGCFGIQTSKRQVINFFFEYGFKPGKKSHSVFIPNYIIESKKSIKYSFIRGLFDTDGCLRFEKINNNRFHTYPKIEFGFASKKLRDNLFELMQNLNYRVHKWGKVNYKLCLAGEWNLKKFMKEIKPKNTKHLNKYGFWKENGYYESCAGVA